MDEGEVVPFGPYQIKLGLLYFIQSGDSGPIKIGRTTNLNSRLRSIQIGSPIEVRLLGTLEGAGWQEQIWHRAFAADRISGEWFKPTADLLAAIEHVKNDWDWPRVIDNPECELLLDLIDIVGEEIQFGDVDDAESLKDVFRQAEADHFEFAEAGMYDERLASIIALVSNHEIARLNGSAAHG